MLAHICIPYGRLLSVCEHVDSTLPDIGHPVIPKNIDANSIMWEDKRPLGLTAPL